MVSFACLCANTRAPRAVGLGWSMWLIPAHEHPGIQRSMHWYTPAKSAGTRIPVEKISVT